ncbi:membrane protein DedA with SNARE-associated domain [Nakamurella sp. UYEF19]|uniref:DedA family protein n=1 Tax=Nakamurella sp. UYEF19 TaxID=1756392 RepID=UPI0033945624
MSLVTSIVDPILTFHGWPAYALVGGLVFAEAALFVGFVLPGETAVILGGVLAYRHSISLPLLLVVVVLAAIIGDSVGYEVGRLFGNRILALRVFRNHQAAIDSGKDRLHRLGGRAVFLGRFTAFLRAVMPGMAGTVGLRYRTFLAWNAAGGIIWGAGFTVLGYLAGASYTKLESYASIFSWVVLGLVVVAIGVWVIRRRRSTDQGRLPGRSTLR